MDAHGNKITDFIAAVVLTACTLVIGIAIGSHERKCPEPRTGNVMLYRQGLEVYSTEELQRILTMRRIMERTKEKRK